jgi:nitroreductase
VVCLQVVCVTVDVFTAMAGRRSCKRFLPKPVEMDKMLQCVQAGMLAPSSGNIQNWKFIVITDIDVIRAMYPYTLNQEPFLSATGAIVVTGDVGHAHMMYGMRGKRLYTIQNCAAAIQNLLLAAYSLELGAIWIGAFDEDRVSDMLGIPQHEYRPQAIILLGYPTGEPEDKTTKELGDVVFFNSFGNKILRPHLVTYDWALEWRHQANNLKGHLQHAKGRMFTRKPAQSQEPADGQEIDRGPDGRSVGDQQSRAAANSARTERARARMRSFFDSLKKDEYK